MTSIPIAGSCPLCGRLPLADDPAAARALVSALRERDATRLLGTEALLRTMSADEVAAVVHWLDGALARPPLHPARHGMRVISAALAMVAYDLSMLAIDPASPVIEGAGQVPQPHPLLHTPFEVTTDSGPLRAALDGLLE